MEFYLLKRIAFENIKKWERKLYPAPNKKHSRAYIPYRIINSKTNINYKGKGELKSLTPKKTKWITESGKFTTNIENLALLATNSIPE